MRSGFAELLAVATLACLPLAAPGPADAGPPVRSLIEQRQDRVVIQKYDISCGAAALATLLRFQHGETVTERQVALGMMGRPDYLADPQRVRIQQGFSLLDMVNFAERRGYRGRGLSEMTFPDLVELAPAVVPIRAHGYNHFVVFRGVLGKTVLIADPAFGTRAMSLDRFMAAWIDYPELGRVAFVVERRDGLIPPNQLAARPEDFVTLY